MKLKITILSLMFLLSDFKSTAQTNSLLYQVRFYRNEYELSTKNKQILSIICDTLFTKSNYIIYINGHSDSDADSSFNKSLSLKRCLAVKDFLIAKGIDESVLYEQAIGEEQPIVANTTTIEKAKNRRVELFVLFEQKAVEKIIIPNKETSKANCKTDTTVNLNDGYKLTLSTCDWEKNKECLQIQKSISYKYNIKENWLKKHIGFKKYTKIVSYEQKYEFNVVGCMDSCFQKSVKLYIPQYQAFGLKIGVQLSQKKNDKNNSTALILKKVNLGDKAFYVANIYCPGRINCSNDSRCTHLINLYVKRNITILSYSYNERRNGSFFDTTTEAKPTNTKKLTDIYTHTFFNTLTILYKGDTVTLRNIPIEEFAHGVRKIKSNNFKFEKKYFLFIPYRKKEKCKHYEKYKIRPRDLEELKRFNLFSLPVENGED